MKYQMRQAISVFVIIGIVITWMLSSCNDDSIKTIDGPEIELLPGFEIEQVYAPKQNGQGSWVSITEGPDRRFYTCDQYGGIYTFIMPPKGQKLDRLQIDSVKLNMGYAQGLLWAFNSLYVVVVKEVNEDRPDDPSSGVYRLTDSNDDGNLDHIQNILTLNGTSEHGPHTLRVGPDGQTLYFIAGNFNNIPIDFKSALPRTWDEDNLFPPYLDAMGHAANLKAPGGWMAKTDPEGMEWTLIGAGMRNPFSFGMNDEGDIFAYDADMEWDFGMPWYRPTRILHVTSGAEFGWRTGSGKWPVYYPDNLPSVTDMAQGSPTAVIMGKDLNFPSRYRNGLFACDWSFGTIYYVDIRSNGSSYSGEREEFLSGVPLPISNAVAGSDGNLYFTTGGRRLESHLYRVSYVGDENTAVLPDTSARESLARSMRDLRRSLEDYHGSESPEAIRESWPHLGHDDRFVRYAARIAIEHQPLGSWFHLLANEKNPTRIIQGCLAYGRSGGPLSSRILGILGNLDWRTLSVSQRLDLLRTYSVLLIRNRDAESGFEQSIINHVNPHFPSNNAQINRELAQLLLYLESQDAVAKCIQILERESDSETQSHPEILSEELLSRSDQYGPQISDMIANMPPTEAIYYVTVLSHVQTGWTRELREKYFSWFYKALSKKGGVSYKAFLDNIRSKALKNVSTEDFNYFSEMSGFYSPMQEMADLPRPIGPGREYNIFDINGIVLWREGGLDKGGSDYEAGERAYHAALCSSCHRINGEGGASGPDLSNIHTRFKGGDMVKAVTNPNEEISEQYAFTIFNLKDDRQLVGRIVGETENTLSIYQSPYDMTNTVDIQKGDILNQEISPLSPMPAKLLDRLNEDEIRNLFAYMISGADPNHDYFKGEKQ